jgi:GNAT superfamily N-acetyltransferase
MPTGDDDSGAEPSPAPATAAPGHGGDPHGARPAVAAGGPTAILVARVPPEVTHPLRGRVLRPGAPPGSARLSADDHPATAAFAATTPAGEVVGTAIVYPDPCPWQPQRPGAWRLRGMATEPGRRSGGIGARVLGAVLDHVRGQGGALVWCNARTPARRFYERAGFVPHGEPWEDPDIGPHIAMWREL